MKIKIRHGYLYAHSSSNSNNYRTYKSTGACKAVGTVTLSGRQTDAKAKDALARKLIRHVPHRHQQFVKWPAAQRCLRAGARIQPRPTHREFVLPHSRRNVVQQCLKRGTELGLEQKQSECETLRPQNENGGYNLAGAVEVPENDEPFECINVSVFDLSWIRHFSLSAAFQETSSVIIEVESVIVGLHCPEAWHHCCKSWLFTW